MLNFFGYTKNELIVTSFENYIAPEYLDSVRKIFQGRMRGKNVPDKYKIELISKNNEQILIEASVTVIMYDEKPASLAILRDLSE
jgi:PAS domain S-box-containing protein